jgi:hypothetical protein
MLKAIEKGSTAFVFHSRKLRDDQPRNCKFWGELFQPGQQPDVHARGQSYMMVVH